MFSRDHSAQKWNDLYASGSSVADFHFILRRDASAAEIEARVPRSATVLDLGCGAGVLTESLLERGYTVSGVDISQDMLDLAGERLQRFPESSYELRQAECEDLPYPDDTFDVVACIGVFGYLDNVEEALTEIGRVLKPGGLLILSVRNYLNRLLFDAHSISTTVGRRLSRRRRRPRAKAVEAATTVGAAVAPGAEIAPGSARATGALSEGTGSPSTGRSVPGFMIDIFDSPGNVIRGVTKCGYEFVDLVGLGYGPPRFAGKRLVSNRLGIVLSRFLQKSAALTRLERKTRWIADVSIYVFEARAGSSE